MTRAKGLFIIVATVMVACVLAAAVALLQNAGRRMETALGGEITEPMEKGGPFTPAWSMRLQPAVISDMAIMPGRAGEFLALGNDKMHQLDSFGRRLALLEAPSKSSRIATDPTGAIPHILVVSKKTKWTGAIDHVVTTDHYLHALDSAGRPVWTKRFDPKDAATLEPQAATFGSRRVVLLSASHQIICFEPNGNQLWSLPLWHHPGTLTVTNGADGPGMLLAAAAPMKEIVYISASGTVGGTWGKGEGPRRFRVITAGGRTAGISVRQVFRRGPGVRHAVAFFAGDGTLLEETELPPDSSLPSYSPIVAMDVDGSGRPKWVLTLSDGTVIVFSLRGEELTRDALGVRVRSVLALPQASGPDLLVTGTHTGLSAWRPVPARLRVRQ
jgi:hypothetical protein